VSLSSPRSSSRPWSRATSAFSWWTASLSVAINRIPKAGQIRSNLAVGGSAVAVDLTARDRELCGIIGPELKRRGLMFVGIDVIGDDLTEINVTSPTGSRALKGLHRRRRHGNHVGPD